MTTTPEDRKTVPGDQEPAEGSRETVDAALQDDEPERRITHDPDSAGVSDYVPDA
jgi:hypothetical protein